MSIFESSKSSPDTLFILLPLEPELSDEQKKAIITHTKQLDCPAPVEVVFTSDLPLDVVKDDEFDESGYVWAIRDGDIVQEYQLEADSFEEEMENVRLWITSQVMAIHHMGFFGDIEIGGEKHGEGTDETNGEKDGEEDSDEDGDYVPEEEGEDEDGEEDGEGGQFDQATLLKQMEMLNNFHAQEEESQNIITPPEVQEMWRYIVGQFNRNTQTFTSFKETVSPFVSQLALKKNPVMKMLGQIMSANGATKDDMEELIEEVSVPNFPRNPKLSNYPPFILKHKKNIASKYEKWEDDYEYITENFLSSETIDENDLDDSFTYEDREWMTLGADIQRIHVGSFQSSKAWTGQYRFKIDVPNQNIIYYMFEFVPSPPPKVAPYERENFRNYILSQLKAFQESRIYKVVIPFDTLHRIQFHESKVEVSLSLAVFQVNQPPDFFVRKVTGTEWEACDDFTKGYQFTQYATHYLAGAAREWLVTLGYLVANSAIASELYYTDLDYDPIEASEEPNFDLPSDAEEEQEDTPFDRVNEGAEEGGDACSIM